uniref:DNA-cytosine methyltransferase n=1 Tax=Klebsiella pneumoniae TaxID=573 RepID=A0A8B0SVW1_KLEPN|nr:DNA-cytosine methyltransferase [Klebsiella pneumoniae]
MAFGFGSVKPDDDKAISRTISARYHKDGSESLVDRGWDSELGEKNFNDPDNMARRPRRLTPRECARLMGFEQPGKVTFSNPRIRYSSLPPVRKFRHRAGL